MPSLYKTRGSISDGLEKKEIKMNPSNGNREIL